VDCPWKLLLFRSSCG
jgi:hypothetical protein